MKQLLIWLACGVIGIVLLDLFADMLDFATHQ